MLRGVNVGGHHKISMDALRAMYVSLGLEDVTTYIQSGNVVFRTASTKLQGLPGRIGSAIERDFGFCPDVIVRTAHEMQDAIDKNPFTDQAVDPSKLAVMFLAGNLNAEGRGRLAAISAADYPEKFHVEDRQIYMYFPNGMGRPRLAVSQIEKAVKVPCTARNWNTVTKLHALAAQLGA